MYAVISLPLESRTRATFLRAELGFLGVIVLTWRQTPRLNGEDSRTGALVLYWTGRRGLRTSWLIVGMNLSFRSLRDGLVWSGVGCDSGASPRPSGPRSGIGRVGMAERATQRVSTQFNSTRRDA